MFDTLKEDLAVIKEKDPAANGSLEILLTYPGLHALWLHRLAHRGWELHVPLLPRLLSYVNRHRSGIDIHPGARLGRRLFIDHGMGVVIGETAEVGDDVTMYQGVTLGGTSRQKGKRHPTIGNDVVIGAGAKILGPLEVGDGARVGAGAVAVKSIPAGGTVVGIPARLVTHGEDYEDLYNGDLPDPVAEMFSCYNHRIDRLEKLMLEAENRLALLSAGLDSADNVVAMPGYGSRDEEYPPGQAYMYSI